MVEAPKRKLEQALSVGEGARGLSQATGVQYRFSNADLAVYGEYELQVLERVLRENREEALRDVIGDLFAVDAGLIGKTPVQVPKLTASLGVEYHFDDAWQGLVAGAGVRYLGESFANSANTLVVPAATVFDASLRYEQDDWGVALNVSNIFDLNYVASCASATSCGYGAGRQVSLSLHKNW